MWLSKKVGSRRCFFSVFGKPSKDRKKTPAASCEAVCLARWLGVGRPASPPAATRQPARRRQPGSTWPVSEPGKQLLGKPQVFFFGIGQAIQIPKKNTCRFLRSCLPGSLVGRREACQPASGNQTASQTSSARLHVASQRGPG